MRTLAAIALLALMSACQQPSAKEEAKNEPLKQYALHGEVLRLDPQGKIAAIKHEKIGDWMEAMTMEFPVKDPAEFDKLKTGETINATVNVQGNRYWVSNIQEAPAQAPASK